MWTKIDQIKSIFCEPRSGRKEGGIVVLVHMYVCTLHNCTMKHVYDKLCMLVDFEEAISSYYQVIAESSPTNQACNDLGE